MSPTFRNIFLLTLLCGLAYSISICSNAHNKFNHHMIKVHESVTKSLEHHQSTTDTSEFSKKVLNIIDIISNSVQPNVPSIIDTKNIPTFAFDKSTCDNLKADQKNNILSQVKSARDSVTAFKGNVVDKKISTDADNSIQYLNTIEKLTNAKCSDITTYLLVGPTKYQTNINTKKSWMLGGITMDDLVDDYINRIQNNDNVTSCGDATPFWNGFKCIDCDEPNPIFNMATSECTACPADKPYFNTTAKECQPCPVGTIFNAKTN